MATQNTATILNIKTDKKLKAEAKKVADDLGLTLTTVVNSMLKQFVVDKAVILSSEPLKPSKWLREALAESQRDYESGDYKTFENVEDMIADLKKM